MANFGEFTEITFNDGAAPPINADNLNAMEGVLALTDQELARSQSFSMQRYLEYFFNRNTKEIDPINIDSGDFNNWNALDSTFSNETSLNILNDQCLKTNMDDNAGGWIGFDWNIDTVDLTEFHDGTASTTDDIIIFEFYISEIASISGQTMWISLGENAAVYYFYAVDIDTFEFDTGWNTIWLAKSSFTAVGGPSWDTIEYLEVIVDYNAGFQNEYLLFQYWKMDRQSSVYSNYPNAFQKYMGAVTGWTDKLPIAYDVYTLVRDLHTKVNKIGMMKLNPANFEYLFTDGNYKNGIEIYEDINMFVSKFEWYCKEAGETPSMTWYIDTTHYAEVYITSDELYLSVANGGAAVDTTWTFDNALAKNEKITIFFEKQDDTFRAIAFKKGEKVGICEYESTFSSYGSLYIGVSNDLSFGILTDFAISHSMNQLSIMLENNPRIVIKYADETVNNSVSMQNDDELYTYLLPNSVYEIELKLIADATNNTPDIKLQWDLTGDVEGLNTTAKRTLRGPSVSCTSVTEIDNMKYAWTGVIGGAIDYGVPATGWAFINESMLLKTGNEGGLIQLQWAQDVAHASNTVVKSGSYMKVTKLN